MYPAWSGNFFTLYITFYPRKRKKENGKTTMDGKVQHLYFYVELISFFFMIFLLCDEDGKGKKKWFILHQNVSHFHHLKGN